MGARPAIHPGQTAGSETHAAQFFRWGLGRRSIPADRVAARRSSLRFGRNTPGPVLPVGAPPSRALSAGRLAPTGRTGRARRSPGFHHRLLALRTAAWMPFPRRSPSGSPQVAAKLLAPPPSRPLDLAACGQNHAAFGGRCIPAETCRFAALIVALRSKYTRASSPGGGSSLARLVSRAPRPHRENWPASALTPLYPQAASWTRGIRAGLRLLRGRSEEGVRWCRLPWRFEPQQSRR